VAVLVAATPQGQMEQPTLVVVVVVVVVTRSTYLGAAAEALVLF
jgi:hypothetical protein